MLLTHDLWALVATKSVARRISGFKNSAFGSLSQRANSKDSFHAQTAYRQDLNLHAKSILNVMFETKNFSRLAMCEVI